MPETESTSDRLLQLETAVAHLQHDFERLHSVALELQAELRQWTLRWELMQRQLQRLESPPEPRSLTDERPPHY